MKKRIFGLLTVLFLCFFAFSFASCSSDDNGGGDESTAVYYTVTFEQDGFEPITKSVQEGRALTDIPAPKEVAGYTVAWEEVDLSNVTQDTTVRAVVTANTYTITYRLNYDNATMTKTEEQVVYGEEFTLETPTVEANSEYAFVKWIDKETSEEVQSGTYLYPRNITLIGVWSDGHSKPF